MGSISSVLFGANKLTPNEQELTSADLGRAEEERLHQLKLISRFSASFYVLPLFLAFYFADLLYFPKFAKEFLFLRLATVIGVVSVNILVQRADNPKAVEMLCTAFVACCSIPLYVMLYMIGDIGTPYYAGLILVIIGMSSGFRFSWPYYFLNVAIVAGPFVFVLPFVLSVKSSSYYFLSALFFLSIVLIQIVSRIFNERLHLKESAARFGLEREVLNRDDIIKKKTEESVSLATLTKQFSPQVVHAIRSRELDISKPVHRSEICVLFIDIVGSTERFVRLDRDDLQKILSMYMEDTMSTLLKYDITIDKFLGDGVLGFCNDPIKHEDYIERSLIAALEIRDRIQSRIMEYNELWMSDFKVSIGISSGYASVGFYGNDLHFKSYTAIGTCVNLAARLGAHGGPDQILVSLDVVSKLSKRNNNSAFNFQFNDLGVIKLKGFEADNIRVYELTKNAHSEQAKAVVSSSIPTCPNGHGILFLDTNSKGIFIFKCRTCGLALDDSDETKKSAA